MLRKVSIWLFSIFYVFASFGANVHVHYCHGELAHISINEVHQCGCPDQTSMRNTCCENELFQIGLEDEQLSTSFETTTDHWHQADIQPHDVKLSLNSPEQQLSDIRPPPQRKLFLTQGRLLFYG